MEFSSFFPQMQQKLVTSGKNADVSRTQVVSNATYAFFRSSLVEI